MKRELPYSFALPLSWYNNCYIDKGTTVKATRPFTIQRENPSEKAVLLIHGFTGYPGELIHPAQELFESGFDVFVPRLPGHGTNGKDFMKSKDTDWIKVCENALSDLLLRYKSVDVVGHSMGGAIAALLMERHKEIRRGVLCCPGINISFLNDKTIKQLKLISPILKKMKKEWKPDERYHLDYEDAPKDDLYLGKEYWSYLYPRQILALSRIAKEAKDNLKKIVAPVLIIGAENDAMIEPTSVYDIQKEIGADSEAIVIKDATHYIYYDISLDAMNEAIDRTVSFLAK